MSSMNLVYGVKDKPKWSKLLVFAFQQVLAVLAATIAVPTIIGLPIQIPAAILGAGLGTLTYLVFTKFKSPVIISSSFAFLGALTNAVAFGYMGIVLGAIFAGLVYVIIALIIHFVGTDWIHKLMPPQIIGPTVALIGLSLAGSAMGDIVKASGATLNAGYNLVALFCGLVTFFTVFVCSNQKTFVNAKMIPFIIGICAGYVTASIFTIFGLAFDVEYLKIVNWTPIVDNFKNIKFTSFLDYPRIALVEGLKELINHEVSPEILAANPNATPITWVGVAEVALAFVPVALVTFAEHVADHMNLSSIIGQDLLNDEPGLKRTLLGDGIGSMVGTIGGICPNTTYGESVGCVAITKNASIRTIFVAALMLIVLSFLTPINCVLRTIPSCVMGGVCLTLYGFIAVSGLKMFKDMDLNDNRVLFTVAAILIVGIGGLSIQIPYALTNVESVTTTFVDGTLVNTVVTPVGQVAKAIQITSIATALLLGILTNTVGGLLEKKGKKQENNNEEGK